MANRRPDDETLAAIRAHWAKWHGGEISDDEIAIERKGRLAGKTKVTFIPERRTSPAWFVCRACPEGGQRYRTDVGVDPLQPTTRHVAAIRRHFKEAHGVARLPAARIYHGGGAPGLAIYLPTQRLVGARFICKLCPEATNRIPIEGPPYGDARSFWELRLFYPDVARRIAGLTPVQRAAQWEAHQRGITAEATQPAIERALREHRASESAREVPEAEVGLRGLLLARVGAGRSITKVIDGLLEQMQIDPDGYACVVARAIPGLAHHRTLPNSALAALARDLYEPLGRDERTLWRIWGRIPRSERDAARRQGTSR